MPQSVATPNMSLATWPTTSHLFDHTELSANWTKVDQHDHSSGKGIPIPAGGLAAGAVTSSALAANAVTTTALNAAAVTDAKLASPNSGVYRPLIQVASGTTGPSPGTYVLANGSPVLSGASGGSTGSVPLFHWDATDYAVAGKTTYLRVTAVIGVNSIAATQTFAFGLYPLTFGGSSGNVSYTLGTVVSSSVATIVNPTTNAITFANSADFQITSGSTFVLGVVITGSGVFGNTYNLSTRLTLHHA
jgi:hypothetical protein